jgi:subtilase family serine protease
VEAGRHRPKGILNDNYLRVTFEIMNPSGTDPLREVEVLVEVEGVSMARVRERFENLEPGVWVRRTVLMGPHRTQHLSGERLALVTVDPENRIAELREDNNRDGKRFRWN